MKAIFRGKVINGRPIMGTDYAKFVHTLEGCEIDQEIYKHEPKRSQRQNKLYFGMLEIISKDTGNSKDYLHAFFANKFLGDKIEVLGEPFVYSRSTTKLTTKQFSTYLENISDFVKEEAGIDLPIE